ncbi:MAG: transglutaminase-like domain-containing protein [Pirellulales bacterium]
MQSRSRIHYPRHLVWLRVGACATLISLLGCRPQSTEPKSNPTASAPGAPDETWEVYYLQGAKIGYGKTVVQTVNRAGQALVQTESDSHLKLERYAQPIEQQVTLETLETSAGQLLEFRTEVTFGPTPVTFSGHVEGDAMVVQTNTQGAQQVTRIPWSADVGGFRGAEQSLEKAPLKPGEKRSLRMLVPLVNQVAEVDLTAADYETTRLLDDEARLLRIETSARLPDGNVMAETLWTDEQGAVLKRRIGGINQESYRTTERIAKATAPSGQPTLDVGFATTVHVDPPLKRAHQSREIRYRVELPMGDPLTAFATGSTQSLRAVSPHVAELTVRSLRPGETTKSDAPAPIESIGTEYLEANSVLQIDDSRIKAMAAEARGDETDPVKTALALERYVHDTMAPSDFTQAFATAAEVALSRSGDCTEHAVLLAALARACAIPSRVAIGLVYVERSAGFGYHMWTEVYVDGQWLPLDATIGQRGIGAAHLKLVDSSLKGATAYSAFLPVSKVVGQLKINVIEAR